MTVNEIVEAFCTDLREFPEEAVNAAIAQQVEVAPVLVQLIEDAASDRVAWMRDARSPALHFALFLVGQFREKAAYRPVVRLAQCPEEHADEIIGDFVTAGLSECLASVFDGDCAPLHELIEDPEAEEFARGSGVEALQNLVLADVLDRAAVLDYYRYLLTEGLGGEFVVVWTCVAICSLKLYPEGLVPELERAYDEGLVDPFMIKRSEIAETMNAGLEKTLEQSRRHVQPFIIDTVAEFGRWASWREEVEDHDGELGDALGPFEVDTKVGRNEACPCGSGKKYKKCCGGA